MTWSLSASGTKKEVVRKVVDSAWTNIQMGYMTSEQLAAVVAGVLAAPADVVVNVNANGHNDLGPHGEALQGGFSISISSSK